MTATLAPAPLTAADRCDRCGARAYIRVVLPQGGELLFCAHHGRRHEEALRAREAAIFDESQELAQATPSSAPAEER